MTVVVVLLLVVIMVLTVRSVKSHHDVEEEGHDRPLLHLGCCHVLPAVGGVLTPAAAFDGVLMERLEHKTGMTFKLDRVTH